MTPQEKQRRAFDAVYDRFPFFASIAATWQVVWSEQVPYAATNGPQLLLNPKFCETLNIAEMTDLVLHELGHVFFGHMYRFPFGTEMTAQEHQEFNVAADAALNDSLIPHYSSQPGAADQGKIVEIAIFPGRRHKDAGDRFLGWPMGKDAEFYHDLVKKSRPPSPPPMGGGQGKPSEDTASGTEGESGEGAEKSPSRPPTKPGKPSTSDKSEAGSGSGAPQASENVDIPKSEAGLPTRPEGERRSDLPESLGDVMPHPIMESGDEDAIEESKEQWQQQIAQGINNARSQGNLPGWIEELATALYGQKSKQNWRAILRRFMTRVVSMGGQTYERPNRRLGYLRATNKIIMPANRSRQSSKGCVLVDTSGSMSKEQCDAALMEIEGILRTFPRCEVDLVMADTRLIDASKKTFHRYDFPLRLPIAWLGRGGTDLCQPILGVAQDRSYKWLVVISDMMWSAQRAIDPKIPTIFVWTPANGEKEPYARATFGTLIGPVEAK